MIDWKKVDKDIQEFIDRVNAFISRSRPKYATENIIFYIKKLIKEEKYTFDILKNISLSDEKWHELRLMGFLIGK